MTPDNSFEIKFKKILDEALDKMHVTREKVISPHEWTEILKGAKLPKNNSSEVEAPPSAEDNKE